MKFNRNKLVVHRIFSQAPRAVFDLGSIGRAHWGHWKKTFVPKRQVCSAGNGNVRRPASCLPHSCVGISDSSTKSMVGREQWGS